MRRKLKMENREIDANMIIKKAPRTNTVRITFSNPQFKKFIFKSRKNVRDTNPNEVKELYINDHLTGYNHKILMNLKTNRKKYTENDPFKSIYSHEGRIFYKLKNQEDEHGTLVKTLAELESLLKTLPKPRVNEASSTSAQTTTNSNVVNNSSVIVRDE